MNDDEDLRSTAQSSADALRAVLGRIEARELDATAERVWHLRGAIDALETLLAHHRHS